MIPVGGENITKDLSIVLKTPTEQAEKIKNEYGHAYYDDASEDELFEVPVIGADTKEQFSQRYISEIIGVRLEELFDLIIDELYRMGIQDLPGGVVLTGGVAKLEGLPQLARHVLQTSVKIYAPNYIGVREPEYTSAVSLIRYAYKESQFNRDVSDNTPLGPVGHEEHHIEQHSATSAFETKEHRDGVLTKVKGFFNRFLE